MQRYVRNTSPHGADIVSVPPQPRHASLNGGEPHSSSGSLAMLAAMRRASSRLSRLVAERCDTAICRAWEKRKCAACA